MVVSEGMIPLNLAGDTHQRLFLHFGWFNQFVQIICMASATLGMDQTGLFQSFFRDPNLIRG